MRVAAKLAISHLRLHRTRAVLTISAIALSVSLVVAVTSGYSSLYSAAHRILAQYLGTADFEITRQNELHGGVTGDLMAQIRADPDVEKADGRLEIQGRVQTADGGTVAGRFSIIGVERPQDTRVLAMVPEQGQWFDRSDTEDAVMDQIALQRLGEKAKLGDAFVVPLVDRQLRLHVTGIVHKPKLLASVIQTVYIPLETMQKFVYPENPNQVSRVMIDLASHADSDAFESRWRDRLQKLDPNLSLHRASDTHKMVDNNLQWFQGLTYLGGSVSMLAATFIVFATLSMGVIERQRTLAMLRAIGAFRAQLGQIVICEGLMLAIGGAIVGVPLGILWIKLLAWNFDQLFIAGAVLSAGGIAFGAGGLVVTALIACLLPALSAMRASPLEAMSPLAQPPGHRSTLWATLTGLALIGVDPLILLTHPFSKTFQFYIHFIIGVPCIMLGFFLIAPATVKFVERFIGPVIAPMFGLRFALLRQQLSSGVWRAAGTCAALMVGLAMLIASQADGTSVIQGWKLPNKFPDMFIYSFAGLGAADQEKLKTVPGVHPDEFMPIAIASPQLGTSMVALSVAALVPDATMFFGIDPELSLKMMELDFREGNAADAAGMLKLGKHVIVTQEYRKLQGIGLGDKLPLKTNKGMVDFTIAGVVWSPGIDVIASLYDLGRQLDQRTAASVFGSLEDAREYFGVDTIHLFAANIDAGIKKDNIVWQIQYQFARKGLDASDVRQLKSIIQRAFSKLLILVAVIAYAAMAIAALGVTNTILASIRSRRWHFGILRSIGVTRSQLVRLVLAEATSLGLVGIALGLGAGFELTINANLAWGLFVGYQPPILVPWTSVSIGIGVVLAISLLASLWPATQVAQTEPLALLQAGRAAM